MAGYTFVSHTLCIWVPVVLQLSHIQATVVEYRDLGSLVIKGVNIHYMHL